MKILIPIICIFVYLIIGYIITTVLLAIDFADWNDEPDMMLIVSTIFQPCSIIVIIFYLIMIVVSKIGKKLAVIPVSIALSIKYILERDQNVKGEEKMKVIPLPELKEILNNKREDALIFEDDIKAIFRKYGDDYYDNYETGDLACVRTNKERAAYMEVLRNERREVG